MTPTPPLEHHINGRTVFNNMTILERMLTPGRVQFRCRCACGGEVLVRGDRLLSGEKKSCGKCALNPNWTRPFLPPEPCGCRPTSDPHQSHRPDQRPVPGPMTESLALAGRRSGMRWAEIADLITPAGSPVACTVEDAKQAVERAQARTGTKAGI